MIIPAQYSVDVASTIIRFGSQECLGPWTGSVDVEYRLLIADC